MTSAASSSTHRPVVVPGAVQTGLRKHCGAMHGLELSLAQRSGDADKEEFVEIATQRRDRKDRTRQGGPVRSG